MKHFFIFIFLFVSTYAATATVKNTKSVYTLKASIVDTYSWSSKQDKYSLSRSNVNFNLLSQNQNNSDLIVLDKKSVTEISAKPVRFLYVVNTKKVHLESIDKAGNLKTLVVKSNMSLNQENLSIYFSNENKNNILKGILTVSDISSFTLDTNKITSTAYNCKLENKNLICSVNYTLQDVPIEIL